MGFLLLEQMNNRIAIDRSDSDSAAFLGLMLKGEVILKLTVAGLVAALTDDVERSQYAHIYRLVRANGIGEWSDVLDALIIGPSSGQLPQEVRSTQRQLTKSESPGSWQHESISLLHECLMCVTPKSEVLPSKMQLRRWFRDFATLRNDTRGHGAQTPGVLAQACPLLEESLNLIESNLDLFNWPWAYLQQNLSGKYRVTPWSKSSPRFEDLKSNVDGRLQGGVYIDMDRLCPVDLIESDVDVGDIWIANGKFNSQNHELISYITNGRLKRDSTPYLLPAQELPPSETQGLGELTAIKNTFTNVPPVPAGYVSRPDLEYQLKEQIQIVDRHPVITLTGYGGIGKTSLALAVINELMEQSDCPYNLVVWFSARDVDLLPSGPKAVQPKGLSANDFTAEYARLVGYENSRSTNTKCEDLLTSQMSEKDNFIELFVFDNFETTTSPTELYRWIDTYIRPPNKVLITSRERSFTGDYAVQVSGMSDDECRELIRSTSGPLGISSIITEDYVNQVIRESRGHPYVIKLILGELARAKRVSKVERIIASQDRVLEALFERSYGRLSVAGQRAFLTLCSWRSSVPRIALEAVLLRPQNELMDVNGAIDELLQMSFIEETSFESIESRVELSVPLSARLFGRRKLTVSPLRASINADSELLQLVGPMNQANDMKGIEPRVRRLFNHAARRISERQITLEEIVPVLEYVSSRVGVGWIFMAELIDEFGESDKRSQIIGYLMKYVENPDSPSHPASQVWKRIADIHSTRGELFLALDALAHVSRQPGASTEDLSDIANQINNLLRSSDTSVLGRDLREVLLRDVADAMERRIHVLSAGDCSRLAWLYMNLKDDHNARRVANSGLDREHDNYHCQRLLDRIDRHPY